MEDGGWQPWNHHRSLQIVSPRVYMIRLSGSPQRHAGGWYVNDDLA